MIKLTYFIGIGGKIEYILVNPRHLIHVKGSGDIGSIITLINGDSWKVNERINDIQSMILEINAQ